MEEEKIAKRRSIVLAVIAVLLCGIVIVKLFFIQVVYTDFYVQQSSSSYIANSYQDTRGSIFLSTKNGERVSAATMRSGYIIALNPTIITQSAEMLHGALVAVLPDVTLQEVSLILAKKDDPYEVLRDRVPKEVEEKVRALGIEGITTHTHEWRFYPGNQMLAQTIGFTGYNGTDVRRGQYGLERHYDQYLRRNEDSFKVNLFAEIFADLSRAVFDSGYEGDIVTTIEPTVQEYAETTIRAIADRYQTRLVNIVIIHPKTGAVYAMAQTPSFDINEFGQVASTGVYQNSLVETIYEFGSVVKPLVIAAGLNEHVIRPDETYVDIGYVDVEDKRIHNFDKKGRGTVTMTRALGESLNTAMVRTERALGNKRFADYMRSYGLGEKSGIDLPSEARGRIQNLESPRDLEYATASFGQGVSFTVFSLVKALSALGNGGHLVQPYIVKEIDYTKGGVTSVVPTYEPIQVLTPETSHTITTMLVEVVDTIMAGGAHKLPHYTIAAKTGTAQIPHPEGGYYEDRNLHSLFGYFPAYNPEFLVYIGAHEPKGVRYASETLSAPFFDIVQFLINYYAVQPDR